MYVPRHFAQTEHQQLFDLIESYAFGLLVTTSGNGPEAAHLPFMLNRTEHTLRCHVARANPIWQNLENNNNKNTLAIFTGPHAYVSPDWYQSAGLVPTWNYAAVHVYGQTRLLDKHELQQLLTDLSQQNEAQLLPKQPWLVDKVPTDQYEKMLRAIVGIEITITQLQGKWKLSQNRQPVDSQGVQQALQGLDNDNAAAVAEQMAIVRLKTKSVAND